jgi:hypothetical protein
MNGLPLLGPFDIMTLMNEELLSRFEANIERLVENAFANFFGKKIHAQDIALQLARAMEQGIRVQKDEDPRPFAPDLYRISLSPQIYQYLVNSHPSLSEKLSQHIVMLATQTGYRLLNTPSIDFVSDAAIERNHVVVTAAHSDRPENSTAAMQRVMIPVQTEHPEVDAYLLVSSDRSFRLDKDIINIGRYRDNDVILDDPYVSRHHLQLRKRFGKYMLFDVHSQAGTFVNNVRVREHQLQPGDVILLGKSQLIYMEDVPHDDDEDLLSQTDTFDPVV